MTANPESAYAEWRVRCGVAPILREDLESPPERLLQAVWQHQRLLREQLRTLDGQPVRILHPGFRNFEGGPDFRGAVVQFGTDTPRGGDIEVDIRASGWHAHGHDRNPSFRNVVLHVVWDSERPAANSPPVMRLQKALDAPLGQLSLWLGSEPAEKFPEASRGKCCAALRELPNDRLMELLRQAAHVRLRSKASQFEARARQAGWEQSLWEGLFRGLGYKHNVWPMQGLGELRPLWSREPAEILGRQARLLGLSGLLPAELTGMAENDNYLRRIWDVWWRERDEFGERILPKSVWRLHGLRPANHPHRRLALAAAWSVAGNLQTSLEQWCSKQIPKNSLSSSLLDLLQGTKDKFWSRHWTLRSSTLKREQPLLGITRVTDLSVNTVLPWLWSRAVQGKNEPMRTRVEERYHSWPAAEDNALLRLARERLLGGAARRVLAAAADQQGLIQIVRDFCDNSNSTCADCKFPELLKRDFACEINRKVSAELNS